MDGKIFLLSLVALPFVGFMLGVGFVTGVKLGFKNHGYKAFIITVEEEDDARERDDKKQ